MSRESPGNALKHIFHSSCSPRSAYRKKHSTETALLYVTSAVKTAMDKKQGTILLLVDFSSAFDTINHNILIRWLRLRYGFVGKALDWVISYLKERTQRVVIGDQSSRTTTLTRGVPQGSVLGPLLFSSNLSVTSYEPMDYSSINMPMIYRYMLILT